MKLNRGTKKLITLTIIIAILIAAYVITMTDCGPPDLTGIEVKYRNIPPNENAFTYFEKAGILLDNYSEATGDSVDTVYPNEYNSAVISNQVARNQQVFRLFNQGLACKRMRFPELKEGYDTLLPYLQPIRMIARLQSNRALHLFMSGRQRDAFNVLIETHRYGCMIQEGKGCLMNYLVGIAVKNIARMRLREFLQATTLAPAVLKTYISLLNDKGASKNGITDALRIEYITFSSFVDDVESGKMSLEDIKKMFKESDWLEPKGGKKPTIYNFKPNLVRKMFAETIRAMIDNVEVPYSKMIKAENSIPWSLRMRISPNKGGKYIYDSFIRNLDRMVVQGGRDRISIGATQLLIALKCYKMVNRRLPDDLDALVPNYIDSIPLDYYDGKPLRYSRSKRVIYSVGEDLKDSGGPDPLEWKNKSSSGSSSWKTDDPGFLINF